MTGVKASKRERGGDREQWSGEGGAVKEEKGLRGGIRREGHGCEIGESRENVARVFDRGEGGYRFEMGERRKEERSRRSDRVVAGAGESGRRRRD